MTVFVSWSGDLSRQIAEILKTWLPDVLQGLDVWISTEDIHKGSVWFSDLSEQLAQTTIGILCLTHENINAPWVLFEAGALAKGLSQSHVCPLLINLPHTDLAPPLSMFNGTLPQRDDMLKLVRTINAQCGERGLPPDRVERVFDHWWDEFDSPFKRTLADYKPKQEYTARNPVEMLEEVLETVRSIQQCLEPGGTWWHLRHRAALGEGLKGDDALTRLLAGSVLRRLAAEQLPRGRSEKGDATQDEGKGTPPEGEKK